MKFKRKTNITFLKNKLDQLEQHMINGYYGFVSASVGFLKEKIEQTSSIEISRSFSEIAVRAEQELKKRKDKIISSLILIKESLLTDSLENSDLKLNRYNNARRELKQIQDKCNEKNLGSDFKHQTDEINKIKEKMDLFYSDLIKERIETARNLTEQKKFDDSIRIIKHLFNIASNIYDFKPHNELKDSIRVNSDLIYSAMIKTEIETIHELNIMKNFDDSIRIIKDIFPIAKNIYDYKLRNEIKERIKANSDLIYSAMIKEEIETSLELNNLKKFDESIIKLENTLNIAKNFNDFKLQKESIEEINQLIYKIRIAKIKKTILDLGLRFPRLQASDIAEECGEDEGVIVSTIKEMIVNDEIYAKYFENSQSVAFDQRRIEGEIEKFTERLDKQFEDWGKKEQSKKGKN